MQSNRPQQGMTLVHVMAAMVVFALAIIPISNLFSQAEMTSGKSKYLFLASTIALGELERYRTGKFSDLEGFGHDWKKLNECTDDLVNSDFGGYPENLAERLEKRVQVSELDPNLRKVVVAIRWQENIQGQLRNRQLNYPLLINRRWRFE